MGAFLPNTTVPDSYPSAPQLGGQSTPYERGQLLIANNPVTLTVFRGSSRAGITQDEYAYVTPSLVPLVRGESEFIYGVLAKNAIPGRTAQISGYLIEPGVAGLGAGSAFTQSVSASGGVTPGVSSVQIQRNGSLVATEPIADFIDGAVIWSILDDPANTRVTITPGLEMAYLEIGADSATASLVRVDLANFGSIAFRNSKYYAEVLIPNLRQTAAGNSTFISLTLDGVVQQSAQIDAQSVANGWPVFLRFPFTPAAGNHTPVIQWNVSAGTATIRATGLLPAQFRIVPT